MFETKRKGHKKKTYTNKNLRIQPRCSLHRIVTLTGCSYLSVFSQALKQEEHLIACVQNVRRRGRGELNCRLFIRNRNQKETSDRPTSNSRALLHNNTRAHTPAPPFATRRKWWLLVGPSDSWFINVSITMNIYMSMEGNTLHRRERSPSEMESEPMFRDDDGKMDFSFSDR